MLQYRPSPRPHPLNISTNDHSVCTKSHPFEWHVKKYWETLPKPRPHIILSRFGPPNVETWSTPLLEPSGWSVGLLHASSTEVVTSSHAIIAESWWLWLACRDCCVCDADIAGEDSASGTPRGTQRHSHWGSSYATDAAAGHCQHWIQPVCSSSVSTYCEHSQIGQLRHRRPESRDPLISLCVDTFLGDFFAGIVFSFYFPVPVLVPNSVARHLRGLWGFVVLSQTDSNPLQTWSNFHVGRKPNQQQHKLWLFTVQLQ